MKIRTLTAALCLAISLLAALPGLAASSASLGRYVDYQAEEGGGRITGKLKNLFKPWWKKSGDDKKADKHAPEESDEDEALEGAPPKPEKETKWGYFVGPMFFLLNSDFSNLDPMTGDRGINSFSDNTFLWGVYGGAIRGSYRFGGFYLTGYQADNELILNRTRRAEIDYMGYGGFFEYSHEYMTYKRKNYPAHVPYMRYGYIMGLMASTGTMDFLAEGPDMGESNQWSASAPIQTAYPYVGLWLSPYDWLWLQIDVGYLMFFMDVSGDEFVNDAGTRMVTDEFGDGVQIGLRFTFGENPNVEYAPPNRPR